MTVLLSDETGDIVKCDDCLRVEGFDTGTSEEFVKTVNGYGWIAYGPKDNMKHKCPKCKRSEKS